MSDSRQISIKLGMVCLILLLNSIFMPDAAGWSQQLTFRHYTVEDGLPSSTVYWVMQDSKGYLWFATEGGISRFDGKVFKNYTTDDGLSSSDNFVAYEDADNRIWFLPFKNKLFYYHHDSIYIYDKIQNSEDYITIGLQQDREHSFWLVNQGVGLIKFDPDTAIVYLDTVINKLMSSGIWELKHYQKQVWTITDILKDRQGDIYAFDIFGFYRINKGQITYQPYIDSLRSKVARAEPLEDGGFIYVGHNNNIVRWKNGQHKILVSGDHPKLRDGSINRLMIDREGYLWIGTLKGLIQAKMDDYHLRQANFYLPGKLITSMREDREGNLWFTTRGHGVYLLTYNAKKIWKFTTTEGLPDNTIYSLHGDQRGNIWMGTNSGVIIHLTKNKIRSFKVFPELTRNSLIKTILYQNDYIFAGVSGLLFILKDNKPVKMIRAGSLKTIESLGEDTIIFGNGAGAYKLSIRDAFAMEDSTINGLSVLFNTFARGGKNRDFEFFKQRTYALQYEDKNIIWIGNTEGLFRYENKQIFDERPNHPLLRRSINDIAITPDGSKWLATHGSGLLQYKDGRVLQINTARGLSSNICHRLFYDHDGELWIATNQGLNRMSLPVSDPAALKIRKYSSNDGLASNEVKDVFISGDTVYSATFNGLSFFNKTAVSVMETPPMIHIEKIKIWEKDTAIQPVYSLNYRQNDINIEFNGLTYTDPYRLQYRYKMENIDDGWIYDTQNSIRYPKLSPGDYTFTVYAINSLGIESEHPATVKFSIQPPFWKKFWFIAFLTGVIIFAIWMFFDYRLRMVKNKTILQQKMLESEQKALRAQMNPHFVFNCLTSIQHFIISKDEDNASLYLSKFAKLIRMILENSQYSFISLQDEMLTLELYLELEALRFKQKISYTITADPAIDQKAVKVPSMVIQPYVENAIKHGLAHKENNARLEVSLFIKDDKLICTIEDNGIGIHQSMALKSNTPGHKPVGMKTTQERLEVLNKLNNSNLTINIGEKKDEQDQTCGTLVEIHIPVKKSR